MYKNDAIKNTTSASEFSMKEEEDLLIRCMNMIDYLSESAINAIYYYLHNLPCPEAKKFLIENPEEFTARTVDQIIKSYYRGGKSPEEPTH